MMDEKEMKPMMGSMMKDMDAMMKSCASMKSKMEMMMMKDGGSMDETEKEKPHITPKKMSSAEYRKWREEGGGK